MIIAAEYSFKDGDFIKEKYSHLLQEIEDVLGAVDATLCKTKISEESKKEGELFYYPPALNKAIAQNFESKGWAKGEKVKCVYSTDYYRPGYPHPKLNPASREIDFLKERLGIEVQFGKYAFMVYNVCAKMTIFHNFGLIDAGIEIVPVKSMVAEMSSGVSYFEQFVWDLENRGVSDIDIPVLIYGIDVGDQDSTPEESNQLSFHLGKGKY